MTRLSSVEVDAAGDALTASVTFRVQLPDGTVVFGDSYAATATRVELERATPVASPVADPDFLTALAGTPAP